MLTAEDPTGGKSRKDGDQEAEDRAFPHRRSGRWEELPLPDCTPQGGRYGRWPRRVNQIWRTEGRSAMDVAKTIDLCPLRLNLTYMNTSKGVEFCAQAKCPKMTA